MYVCWSPQTTISPQMLGLLRNLVRIATFCHYGIWDSWHSGAGLDGLIFVPHVCFEVMLQNE